MRSFIAIVFAILPVALPAHAQANRMSVYFSVTAEDQLGKQLAFSMREAVRSSSGYVETYNSNDPGVSIKLVTLDPDDRTSQSRTIYSWTMTINPPSGGFEWYITSSVGFCGASKIEECARGLFRDMGAEMEEIRAAFAAVRSNQ